MIELLVTGGMVLVLASGCFVFEVWLHRNKMREARIKKEKRNEHQVERNQSGS